MSIQVTLFFLLLLLPVFDPLLVSAQNRLPAMRKSLSTNAAAIKTVPVLLAACLCIPTAVAETEFKKATIDDRFRSEGVAVADINRDGKQDVIVGDVWYEAPDWEVHEIREPTKYEVPGDYSEAFGVYADDFNDDGWVDVLVIPFHGKDARWYENPKKEQLQETDGPDAHWNMRVAFKETGNETRIYPDLFDDGEPVFLMGVEGRIAWVPVPDDPNQPWPVHYIQAEDLDVEDNPAHKYAHGLGVGDVNGDGRRDVIFTDGWFEQPEQGRQAETPWTFHPVNITPDAADMYAADLDGDGRNDVLASSAHKRGIWFSDQTTEGEFKRHTLDKRIPVTHALQYVDIDGDETKDLVTGQRPGTHGSTDFSGPTHLYWYDVQPREGDVPKLEPHKIDANSGIGTQFVTTDVNGDNNIDILTSNKKGVFLFLQK